MSLSQSKLSRGHTGRAMGGYFLSFFFFIEREKDIFSPHITLSFLYFLLFWRSIFKAVQDSGIYIPLQHFIFYRGNKKIWREGQGELLATIILDTLEPCLTFFFFFLQDSEWNEFTNLPTLQVHLSHSPHCAYCYWLTMSHEFSPHTVLRLFTKQVAAKHTSEDRTSNTAAGYV